MAEVFVLFFYIKTFIKFYQSRHWLLNEKMYITSASRCQPDLRLAGFSRNIAVFSTTRIVRHPAKKYNGVNVSTMPKFSIKRTPPPLRLCRQETDCGGLATCHIVLGTIESQNSCFLATHPWGEDLASGGRTALKKTFLQHWGSLARHRSRPLGDMSSGLVSSSLRTTSKIEQRKEEEKGQARVLIATRVLICDQNLDQSVSSFFKKLMNNEIFPCGG